MLALLRLAATSFAVSAARQRAKRAVRHGALLFIVAAVATTGLGFLTSAVWMWLAGESTPMIASIVVGGVLLATAVVTYVVASVSGRLDSRGGRLEYSAPGIANQLRLPPDSNLTSLAGLMAVVGTGYVLGRIAFRK